MSLEGCFQQCQWMMLPLARLATCVAKNLALLTVFLGCHLQLSCVLMHWIEMFAEIWLGLGLKLVVWNSARRLLFFFGGGYAASWRIALGLRMLQPVMMSLWHKWRRGLRWIRHVSTQCVALSMASSNTSWRRQWISTKPCRRSSLDTLKV